ncbi:MAG TPA: response regulator, partial [Polyangiaceae bacterium]|nr:response regulator [Polyangiaceae bacterium]
KPAIALVVDEVEPPRSLVEGLTRFGHEVRLASDVATARSLFRACTPALVLLELHVGQASGLDLLAEFRLVSPHTRFVIVTMYGSIESARLAMASGADDYFTKPVTARELLPSVAACADPMLPSGPAFLGVQAMRKQYIEQVLAQCGSIAQTSRLLRVERRSLRRMLRRA